MLCGVIRLCVFIRALALSVPARIFLAVLAGLAALTSSANASFSDCRSIADPMQRLACYDKAAKAPAPAAKSVAAQPAAAPVFNAVPPGVDPASVEPSSGVFLPVKAGGPRYWFQADAGVYGFSRNVPVVANMPPAPTAVAVPTSPGFIGLDTISSITNSSPTGAPINPAGGANYGWGYWLNPQQTAAIEVNAFFALGYAKASPMGTLTTNNYINTTPDVFVGLSTDTTSTVASGGIWDLLYGADVNYRMTVPQFPYLTDFALLFGVRSVALDEFTTSTSTVFTRNYNPTLGLPSPGNAQILNSFGPSSYGIWNTFIGPQIGFDAEKHWGRFWVESEDKVAAGGTIEPITTGPTYYKTTPTAVDLLAGFILPVNSGAPVVNGESPGTIRFRGAFTVVPSGTLKIGYDIIPGERSVTVAYNYLYMSDVGLIAEQSPLPFGVRQSSFLAQGITFGLKERF